MDHAKRSVLADFCSLFSEIPRFIIYIYQYAYYTYQFSIYCTRIYYAGIIIVLRLLDTKIEIMHAGLLVYTETTFIIDIDFQSS